MEQQQQGAGPQGQRNQQQPLYDISQGGHYGKYTMELSLITESMRISVRSCLRFRTGQMFVKQLLLTEVL